MQIFRQAPRPRFRLSGSYWERKTSCEVQGWLNPVSMSSVQNQNRARELVNARLLVMKVLESRTGWTETDLRTASGLSQSVLHEILPQLIAMGEVVVSQSGPNRVVKQYHLALQDNHDSAQEGPLTPLAHQVLTTLRHQGEGARSLSNSLGLDLNMVQSGLDELLACRRVVRTQVGMLVIYKVAPLPRP